MDTHSLQAFLAVADSQSFSLAAESLFLTQPAVSKRIAALEQELDARLFDRLGKRVVLTEAGQTLLPRARHIIQELADSRQLIANLSEEISGTLQMATSHHLGLHRLPDVLRDYSLRYPQVELDIRFTASEIACEAVAAGEKELAVVTLPEVTAEKLNAEKIWDDPLSIMVNKQHPLLRAKNKLEALALYPAILPDPGTVTRRLIEQPLEAQGIQLKVGLETNYLETIRMLVTVGLGWSVLPLTMQTDELSCIKLEEITFKRQLGVVTHKNRTLSRAAQAFIQILVSFKT
ncbi:MAG: LysR family transcriptional regulator [Gammaproteobacteria bacterium]|nr:LysR family transcriptional regulator [Gammaproteobacteria bacterium]